MYQWQVEFFLGMGALFVFVTAMGILFWRLNVSRHAENLARWNFERVMDEIAPPPPPIAGYPHVVMIPEERREEYARLLEGAGWVFFKETPGSLLPASLRGA